MISPPVRDRIFAAIGGSEVRTSRSDQDEVVVEFGNGCFFAFYNSLRTERAPVGGTLTSIENIEDRCRLTFSNGAVLEIALDAASYVGPEAMQFSDGRDLIVVWR